MKLPGDKSLAHRALLLAALARTPSRIENLPDGDDVKRTATAIATLMVGPVRPADGVTIDCGNSGTLVRLLMGFCAGGVLAGAAHDVTLIGDASLSRRPMGRVAVPLRTLLGSDVVELTPAGTLPARVRWAPLAFRRLGAVDTGVASAQVKSALVLAAREKDFDVVIHEATATRDHTERMIASLLARPGSLGTLRVEPHEMGASIHVRGPLAWDGFDLELPGDPSSAALLAAFAIASGLAFAAEDLLVNPRRAGFWRVLVRMGLDVDMRETGERLGEPVGDIAITQRGPLTGVTVPARELPDLVDEVPALVVVALHARGTTRIEGAGELRVKESDRLALLVQLVGSFGGRADIDGDALVVHGRAPSLAAPCATLLRIRTDGDHRIAMAAHILARIDDIEVSLDVEDAAATSFPGFAAALDSLDPRGRRL